MTAHIGVIWPRTTVHQARDSIPYRDPTATHTSDHQFSLWHREGLRQLVSQLLEHPANAIDIAMAVHLTAAVRAPVVPASVLWLPHGNMLTEAFKPALKSQHGVGIWIAQSSADLGADPAVRTAKAFSFGPAAVQTYSNCLTRACVSATASPEQVARHLVLHHHLPLAGPRPGLIPWPDGNARARMLLAGKDRTLRRLAGMLRDVEVDTGYSVSLSKWRSNPQQILANIFHRYPNVALIARSCAEAEDGWQSSQAGAFASVAVPHPPSAEHVTAAIEEVFHSYGQAPSHKPSHKPGHMLSLITGSHQPWKDRRTQAETLSAQDGPRVLVQRWLHPVDASAVVTTRTLSGAPYLTAVLDMTSGRTDAITAGTGQQETWYIRRHDIPAPISQVTNHAQVASKVQESTLPPRAPRPELDSMPRAGRRMLEAALEAEHVAGTSYLDVELAYHGGTVHLLQARPLAAAHPEAPGYGSGALKKEPASQEASSSTHVRDAGVHQAVAQAQVLLKRALTGPLARRGAPLLLSSMCDWNPSEMLGRRPSTLACSLYRDFITDRAWAQQRAEYGYRDLRGVRLMHVIAGSPYVDAAASLESFIPRDTPEPIAQAVRRAMYERLELDPLAHDKVEFEIAATCWTPTISERLRHLADFGIGAPARAQLQRDLLNLTRRGVQRLPNDAATLHRFPRPCQHDANPARLQATAVRARAAAALFAHLARAAFVATDLLRTLNAEGLNELHSSWIQGLTTVTAELYQDGQAVNAGQLPWHDFCERHRWLRPGTYDVTVPAYGSDPEGYLRPLTEPSPAKVPLFEPDPAIAADRLSNLTKNGVPQLARFPWPVRHSAAVGQAVGPLGLDDRTLESFCAQAIRAREQGKALYAAWISATLESIAARGAQAGLTRHDVQHLTLKDLEAGTSKHWPRLIARRREQALIWDLVELPDVITSPSQLDCFSRGPTRANFVTTRCAEGRVLVNPTPHQPPAAGCIIVLEAADPGFDWVFAHRPAALITAYGGANSHMAIRCAELSLPAAIGVGPQAHRAYSQAARVRVDARTQRVDVLA